MDWLLAWIRFTNLFLWLFTSSYSCWNSCSLLKVSFFFFFRSALIMSLSCATSTASLNLFIFDTTWCWTRSLRFFSSMMFLSLCSSSFFSSTSSFSDSTTSA